MSKFHQFINQKFQVTIKWIPKEVKSLFSLKDKNTYPACQFIKKHLFVMRHIGKTIRNVDIRRNEHEDILKESEPVKHLWENLNHKFKWETLPQGPKNYRERKNLEIFSIAIMGPTLNNQLDTKKFYLFCNSVT